MAIQTERLDMRLSLEHKKLIEQAASLKGQSLSAWVKFVLLSEAQEVIDAHARTLFSRRDWDAFLELVDSNDEPAAALTKAVEQHQTNRVDR